MAFNLLKPPKVSELNRRIALCKMHDVVEKDGNMSLSREAVVWCWAAIRPSTNMHSFLAPNGINALEARDRETHRVIVRAALGVEVTSAAWVYEWRRKSSPRWYKFLGFTDLDPHWLVLTCHLVERSDNAASPQEPVSLDGMRAEPMAVKL